ncbi:MAG: hypothetical protein GY798_28915 [Hyphomicrobiales bacterium]|nr:hypothetical protein [Hyphomicrobiales bacterium]
MPRSRSFIAAIITTVIPVVPGLADARSDCMSMDPDRMIAGCAFVIDTEGGLPDSGHSGTRGEVHVARGDIAKGLADYRTALAGIEAGDPMRGLVRANIASVEDGRVAAVAVDKTPGPRATTPRVFQGAGLSVAVVDRHIDGQPAALVTVEGDFEWEDEKIFRQAIRTVDRSVVFVSFDSFGGDLRAGLEIGRLIWINGYRTVVDNGTCASACALAWLAGRSQRFATQSADIGFHVPWRMDGSTPRLDAVGTALVGSYLSDLGLGAAAIEFIHEKSLGKMNWLQIDRARKVGIDVQEWNQTDGG